MAINRVVQIATDRIEQRYNGDNDLIPGAPVVLWADYELCHSLKSLAKQVGELEDRLASLSLVLEEQMRNKRGANE